MYTTTLVTLQDNMHIVHSANSAAICYFFDSVHVYDQPKSLGTIHNVNFTSPQVQILIQAA